MTEFELIDKLASVKVEAVAPFEIATTHEQWEKLFPREAVYTVEDMTKYYLSHQSVFEKTATKITFHKCDLTNNDLCRAVEELTRGFDKKECRQLLDTLTAHKARLSEVCKEYKKIWGKPAPIEFVCDLLESKSNLLTAQPDIMTNRAKKYFEKARQAGFMEQTETGYKWTFNKRGRKAALCYFLLKVYNPDMQTTEIIHYKALEQLFGETRLDSALAAMLTTKKPQPWRSIIDNLFE